MKLRITLLVLCLILAACGASQADTKGQWDNSKWDSAIWQ